MRTQITTNFSKKFLDFLMHWWSGLASLKNASSGSTFKILPGEYARGPRPRIDFTVSKRQFQLAHEGSKDAKF